MWIQMEQLWAGGRLIIVHGHTNKGMFLSADALNRCNTAIELFRPSDILIITGGVFNKKQRNISVAQAMQKCIVKSIGQKYSEERFVYDHVLIEDKSRTTIENVELLKKEFGDYLNNASQIIYITSGYHISRCQYIWDNLASEYKRVLICPVKPWQKDLSSLKAFVELVGLVVTWCYLRGFKWPENFFRRKARTI